VCCGRGQLKCDGTHAETRFRISPKQTSPFKSAGASVHSTTSSQGVRMSSSDAGYTMFQGSVKGTGYRPHLPVSPSLPLPYVTMCHHISTGIYCKILCFLSETECSVMTLGVLDTSFISCVWKTSVKPDILKTQSTFCGHRH